MSEQYLLGMDEDGVTRVSLEALREIAYEGKILEKIEIAGNGPMEIICSFIFKDHGVYNASGFSIGYGGEGPNGLYQAIKLFHPDKIEDEFSKTAISKLDPDKGWNWYPMKGFISA